MMKFCQGQACEQGGSNLSSCYLPDRLSAGKNKKSTCLMIIIIMFQSNFQTQELYLPFDRKLLVYSRLTSAISHTHLCMSAGLWLAYPLSVIFAFFGTPHVCEQFGGKGPPLKH